MTFLAGSNNPKIVLKSKGPNILVKCIKCNKGFWTAQNKDYVICIDCALKIQPICFTNKDYVKRLKIDWEDF